MSQGPTEGTDPPSEVPTASNEPTGAPTVSESPSSAPTEEPTLSAQPSALPTDQPSVSNAPSSSNQPTLDCSPTGDDLSVSYSWYDVKRYNNANVACNAPACVAPSTCGGATGAIDDPGAIGNFYYAEFNSDDPGMP